MFPVELLSRIVEIVLGDVAKDAVKRGQDRKRRFARELFGYYEVVKEYRQLCQELISLVEREKQLVPSGRMTPGTARHIQEVSLRMAERVETLVGAFEGELWDYRRDPEGGDSKPDARRRFGVLEVYNSQLARLMDCANHMDHHVSHLAKQMSALWVDWDKQQLTFLEPSPEGVAAYIEGIGLRLDIGGLQAREPEVPGSATLRGFVTIEFEKAADCILLVDTLKKNVSAIDELLEAIAAFLREKVEMADLL
jgi:hypothetical protein